MSYLVDTNILSELSRLKPNAGVIAWAETQKQINLSAITVEEILFGLNWKPNQRIQTWFNGFLQQYCQILPVTEFIAKRGGGLRGQLQAAGQTRSQADMLIAATATAHELTLVTRNEKDFQDCDILLLNPFI